MRKKIRLGILCGGQSAEHEVSLISARSIIDTLDADKYDVHVIGIDKSGAWHLRDNGTYLACADNPKLVHLSGEKRGVTLLPSDQHDMKTTLDVIFPVLHGPYGEDGSVQGMLKLAGIPFVGAGVLGSAIGMDKDVMKRLLRDAGIPTARFITLLRQHDIARDPIIEQLGLPLFVKPANLGSSVGIVKVKSAAELLPAIEDAFLFDRKVIVEEFIPGREIECAVLGNEYPVASLPGELIPTHEFYSYEAKYVDAQGAHFKIPAELPAVLTQRFQKMAIDAFQVLCCEGMARVDFFLKDNEEIVLNEINTIPGFTKISMYPKLWEASGMPYSQLLDQLIQLAFERFEKEKAVMPKKVQESAKLKSTSDL